MELKVDGATIHYQIDGPEDAPAVLLWHGAYCTLRMWDFVIERIVDRFRLVRFDVRGVGLSTPTEDPEAKYTFEQYADDANGILNAHGIERCHVWSTAWGTRAAIAYCSLSPERVISAALYDASIGAADVTAQREGYKKALELQIQSGIKRFDRPEGWNVHNTPDEVPAALAAARKFDLPGVVPMLTMPVLVATGDHDPNLASSKDLVKRAPDAGLVILENVGHGSVMQRPDLAADVFLEFQASLAD